MFSVNQMNNYHVLLEAFNVINYNSADKIREKWMSRNDNHYSNRRSYIVTVPKVDHITCQGFSWYGARAWNQLPERIKMIKDDEAFKNQIKKYIWETIPSY